MKRFIFGTLLLTGLFVLSGCGKKTASPEELFLEYASLLTQGRYEEMYPYLTAQAQEHIDPETFAARYRNIYEGMGASDIRVNFREQGKEGDKKAQTRLVPYTLTMDTVAGELTFEMSALFKKDEEGGYKMEWESQYILPGLAHTDRVRVVTTPAVRGQILDRNQVMLAGEGTASSVGLVPGKLLQDRTETVENLAALLEISPEKIESALGAGWVRDDTFVPIRTISRDAQELEKQLLEIPGVMITNVPVRYYPFGKKAAQLTGYVQNITAEELEERQGQGYHENSVLGKAGAERVYEERLRPRDGYAIQILDQEGNVKSVVLEKAPQDGQNVILTIDITLQQYWYQELEGERGCAVALNPENGAVLAMVSTPAYDPNDFVMGYTSRAWEELNGDEARPLYNRFLSSWVPGSVMKPVTAALGITDGSLDPEADIKNEGLRWQKDPGWGGYYVTTLTDYPVKNLENALIYSDNIYFAKAAVAMGAESFSSGLGRLGFGEELEFDLDLKPSSLGDGGEISSETELADSGYGQGKILVNPLHLACIYSAFVNEGNMVKPYLLEGDEGGFWKEQVFTPEAAGILCRALYRTVEEDGGPAHEAWREEYRLGGKTGTAELKDSREDAAGRELGWFAGFCVEDTEHPIVGVMMVEDVQERGGSHVVIPKFMQGFDRYCGGN